MLRSHFLVSFFRPSLFTLPTRYYASHPMSGERNGKENKSDVEEFDPRKRKIEQTLTWSSLPRRVAWSVGNTLSLIVKRPAIIGEWYTKAKGTVYHECRHYYLGTKLLVADTKTAWKLMRRVLKGEQLTRRERRMLLRTAADLFRLVPFSFFVIVPFAEFSLPFFLAVFPNMLPSQFQEKLQEVWKLFFVSFNRSKKRLSASWR